MKKKSRNNPKITIVSPEFYKTVVPHKEFADKTFGFTDKPNNRIYVKRAKNDEETINRLIHEMQELYASKSPHQVDGIRYGFFSDIGDWFQENVSDPVKEVLDPILPESVKDNPLATIGSLLAAPFTGGTSLLGLIPFGVESTAGQFGLDIPHNLTGLASGLMTGASLGGAFGSGWNAPSSIGGTGASAGGYASELFPNTGFTPMSNASWSLPSSSSLGNSLGMTAENLTKLGKDKNAWNIMDLFKGSTDMSPLSQKISNIPGIGEVYNAGWNIGEGLGNIGQNLGFDLNLGKPLGGMTNIGTNTGGGGAVNTLQNLFTGGSNQGGGSSWLTQLLPSLMGLMQLQGTSKPTQPNYPAMPEQYNTATNTYADLLNQINTQDYFKPIQDYLDMQRGNQQTQLRSQAAAQGNLDSTGFMNQLADMNKYYDVTGANALSQLQQWGIGQESNIASQLANLGSQVGAYNQGPYNQELQKYNYLQTQRDDLKKALMDELSKLLTPQNSILY